MPLSLSVYLIFLVFIIQTLVNITRLSGERDLNYSHMTMLKWSCNFTSLLLSLLGMLLFFLGLRYPEVYTHRKGVKWGCLVMALDHLVTGCGWIMEHTTILPIVMGSSAVLGMYTWFSIVCYKWEIDDIRKNLIVNVGVPIQA